MKETWILLFSHSLAGLKQVMVNLEPTETGPVTHLKSMHNAEGCQCHKPNRRDICINHYLGSHGDYMDR